MASQKDTLIGLNTALKLNKNLKSFKQGKKQVEKQKKHIENIKKKNNKTKYQILKLKKEQVRKGTPAARVRQIDKMLKSEDYRLIDLKAEKNYFDMIQGKDFYYVVNDGFKKTKIKRSKLIKMENPALYFSKGIEKEIRKTIKYWEGRAKKKGLSKQEKKFINKKIDGYGRFLKAVEFNTKVLQGEESEDESQEGEYPMQVMVVGEIIKIN